MEEYIGLVITIHLNWKNLIKIIKLIWEIYFYKLNMIMRLDLLIILGIIMMEIIYILKIQYKN